MTESEIYINLFSDLNTENDYPNVKPYLAHYTTLANLEKILANNEVWFSNPLL